MPSMNRDEGIGSANLDSAVMTASPIASDMMSRDTGRGPLLPTHVQQQNHGHQHGGGGGGHGHQQSKSAASYPETSIPSNEEMGNKPSIGLASGCKALVKWAVHAPVDCICAIGGVSLLLYALYLSVIAVLFHYSQDCLFGLLMRVLIGRNAVILLDCLWIHLMLYKAVYVFHFGAGVRMGRDKLAVYRVNNRQSIRARLCQVFIVCAPLFYFMFDGQIGCSLVCCPTEAVPEMVPDSYMKQSILALVMAVPCVMYVLTHSLDPVENAWIRANKKG